MHTRTNANSVPMLVRLYVSPASPISDHNATKMPVISVVMCGTRVLAWTLAAHDGSSPSRPDRKSTRLNSSHSQISYAVFCLKKKTEAASPYFQKLVVPNTAILL